MVIFNVPGIGKVDVTNWPEIEKKLLAAIGFALESEIRAEIKRLELINTSEYWQSIQAQAPEGNTVTVTSDSPAAQFLEFGTAGTRKGVNDPFGKSRGPNRSRKMPVKKVGSEFVLVDSLRAWAVKKGIPESAWFPLAKHIQMFGLEPFAPFRRVINNKNKMEKLVQEGFDVAVRQS